MILSYHNIAETAGHYTVSTADFRAQLDFLQGRYRVVSLSQYLETMRRTGRNDPGEAVLTFDDAFQSFADLVLPLLRARQLPAVLFVPTGFLGKRDEWNPPALRYPIMHADTLRRIAGSPLLTVGSHTVSHPRLACLGPADLRRELADSKAALETLIDRPIDFLAYPFGQPHIDFNATVQKAARDAGYSAALGTSFSIFNKSSDLFGLNRITVESNHGLEGFAKAIRPGSLRAMKQRVKNAVSRLRYR